MTVRPSAKPGPPHRVSPPAVPRIPRPSVPAEATGGLEADLMSPAFQRAVAADPVGLARAVMALNLPVHDASTLLGLLGRAARITRELVPGVLWVSVTARVGRARPFTAYSSNPAAAAIDAGMPEIEKAVSEYKLDDYYDKALSLVISGRAREAFNLIAEPEAVRDLYGRTTFGQSCLLARRLGAARS